MVAARQSGRVALRALIVDDHAGFRATARDLLEDAGYVVVGEAEDGEGAVAAANELRPDLVLLDIQLPDIDGFEVAERLRSTVGDPVVVLTSSRDVADYGDLVERSPARGFVPKAELSAARLAALVG